MSLGEPPTRKSHCPAHVLLPSSISWVKARTDLVGAVAVK
jgi:hypothetical protein